jgi:hypothetical protein
MYIIIRDVIIEVTTAAPVTTYITLLAILIGEETGEAILVGPSVSRPHGNCTQNLQLDYL